MSINVKRAAARVVELYVQRTAGLSTSNPHSVEHKCVDQWNAEVGPRGVTAVDALRGALQALPADKAVTVAGVPELVTGHAGELLARLPATGAQEDGRGSAMKRWLGTAA